jgi:hypothetical protein
VIPKIWDNKDAKDSDPWWECSAAVDECNRHHRGLFQASCLKVEDESMSESVHINLKQEGCLIFFFSSLLFNLILIPFLFSFFSKVLNLRTLHAARLGASLL